MTDPPDTVEGLARKIRRVIVKQLTTKPMRNIAEMEAQTAWIDSQIEIAIEDFADSRVRDERERIAGRLERALPEDTLEGAALRLAAKGIRKPTESK